ncbi:MAG: hypothetical protein LBD44_05775 [Spirochaetaceae bacterium]|nr:hypothetical protein [Spirochaetaceae bacterium]
MSLFQNINCALNGPGIAGGTVRTFGSMEQAGADGWSRWRSRWLEPMAEPVAGADGWSRWLLQFLWLKSHKLKSQNCVF